MSMLLRTKTLAVIVVTLGIAHMLMPVFPCGSSLSAATSGNGAGGRSAAATGAGGDVAKRRAVDVLGKLPLRFEENEEQAGNGLKFVAHAAGFDCGIMPTEAVMGLHTVEQSPASFLPATSSPTHIVGVREQNAPPASLKPRRTITSVRMRLVGANRRARVVGENQLASRTNYFIGKDTARWLHDVANYEQVRVEQVYRGIDVVYYGSGKQLEYDFKVAPGVDIRAIRLRFDGARSIRIDEKGDLSLATAVGVLRQHKPVAYQLINGVRREIPARFLVNGKQTASPYMDIVGAEDQGLSIAVDSAGSAYVTGRTKGRDFPTTPGALKTTRVDDLGFIGSIDPAIVIFDDAFVTKLNPAGTALVYSTYLGGHGEDSGSGIKVDNAGYAYVIGTTQARDFPTTNPLQASVNGGADAFVARLNQNGSALVYSTYIGGTGDDTGNAITQTFFMPPQHPSSTVLMAEVAGEILLLAARALCLTRCWPLIRSSRQSSMGLGIQDSSCPTF